MSFAVFDSITHVDRRMEGQVVLAASHAGAFVAQLVLALRLGGAVLGDAGIGRERAGIGGLEILERYGVPAAAVDGTTARIGDGEDCYRRGIISSANGPARTAGALAGTSAKEAMRILRTCTHPFLGSVEPGTETRKTISIVGAREVVLVDSASLIESADTGKIVVTGSHGGLLGGKPQTAVKYPVFAAIFNDAGVGCDRAGISRLAALDASNIAGATVSAWSARIGDAHSSYADGYISAVNRRSESLGGEVGLSCRELVARLAVRIPQKH
jgi:hypothetical protein